MTLLNIAEICPQTETLGPGKRFVIWLQGCCFNCSGCISPDWIPQTQANLIEPIRLANYIALCKQLNGLTISGGEPMLQAKALSELLTHIRSLKDISIICYSGFTLQQLQTQSDIYIDKILSLIDVLIDGQYISQLNDNKGIRGSSNQIVHFLTSRHLSEQKLFNHNQRNIEIHLANQEALMVGVPPHNFSEQFSKLTNQ